MKKFNYFLLCCIMYSVLTTKVVIAQGTVCIIPDNGNGTIDLPAICPYTTPVNETININGGLASGDTKLLIIQLLRLVINHLV